MSPDSPSNSRTILIRNNDQTIHHPYPCLFCDSVSGNQWAESSSHSIIKYVRGFQDCRVMQLSLSTMYKFETLSLHLVLWCARPGPSGFLILSLPSVPSPNWDPVLLFYWLRLRLRKDVVFWALHLVRKSHLFKDGLWGPKLILSSFDSKTKKYWKIFINVFLHFLN